MRVCHHCGRELQLFSAKVERTAGCPYCHSDLKVCLNCRLHDPGANNQCREPQAEWQTDKDKANFCEFFEFREISLLTQPGHGRGAVGRGARPRRFRRALREEEVAGRPTTARSLAGRRRRGSPPHAGRRGGGRGLEPGLPAAARALGGLLSPATRVPRHRGRARREDLRGAVRDGASRGRPRRLPHAPVAGGRGHARPGGVRPGLRPRGRGRAGARPRARESPALALPALPARRPAARGGAGARSATAWGSTR